MCGRDLMCKQACHRCVGTMVLEYKESIPRWKRNSTAFWQRTAKAAQLEVPEDTEPRVGRRQQQQQSHCTEAALNCQVSSGIIFPTLILDLYLKIAYLNSKLLQKLCVILKF